MPKKAKTVENLDKHLTKAEMASRTAAEASVTPQRSFVTLKAPDYVRNDARAKRYWRNILVRIRTGEVELLDDLDTEVLGVYVSMLSRRDQLQHTLSDVTSEYKTHKAEAAASGNTANAYEEAENFAARVAGLDQKLQGLERGILSYADKLGLTPSGRAHLARKRAAAEIDDADIDLFGG